MRHLCVVALALAGTLVGGCSLVAGPAGPPPLEAPPLTPLPAAEVQLVVQAPEGTPPDAEVEVELFDPIAGFSAPASVLRMQPAGDGTWVTTLTPTAGSVIAYRFVRTSPGRSAEASWRGEPVVARLGVIDGPGQLREVISAWADSAGPRPNGRIVGTLFDALTGNPLPDILVNAGGRHVFTDGQGAFRIDDLPPGLHTLAAVSPTGAYHPIQQGAIVADSSETPAALGLTPARPIVVTFQVTVPPDTPPQAALRVAGNILALGNTFAGLGGGPTGSVGAMPELVRVDGSTYLAVVGLYSGTALHYRYTLGDGVWNTERDPAGNVITRQAVLPDTDITLVDVVSTWHPTSSPGVTFEVHSTAGMPPTDLISLQLRSSSWREPLPMWPSGPGTWAYALFGPVEAGVALPYRYCRNQQCGAADDAETRGLDPTGRQVVPGSAVQMVSDEVSDWAWLLDDQPGAVVVAPEIQPRPAFEVGFEIAPVYSPAWIPAATSAMRVVRESGANAVVLSPAWVLHESDPVPQIGFDPQHAPLLAELEQQILEARELELAVGLHPRLILPDGNLDAWWSGARRDGAWWTVFFERYRSMVLTYAGLAERTGAAKLVVGGPETAPALPGGLLADGSPSGAPIDAEARWRSLLQEVRLIYSGPIAFEIEFGRTLHPPPAFLDAVDQVHVYWHVPLGEGRDLAAPELQQAAFAALDGSLLAEPSLKDRAIYLSVEYLSLDGGATACAPLPDGTCRPAEAFDAGLDPDPDLALDLAEQSDAHNAVILAAYAREAVQGFYARRYHPPVALHDKSASVNGKPAGQMLGYWYPRISGR